MRVAFLNRLRSVYEGGDLIQIDSTIAALAKIGVEATYITDPWDAGTLKAYDLAHIFHVNFSWSRLNFQRTWASGIPYVVTPIYYPGDLGMSAWEISVACKRAHAAMPFSKHETNQLRGIIPATWRFTVVPNGTSESFHFPNAGDREGVLVVSAREGDKNADKIREACLMADIPFRCATGVPHAQMPFVYRQYRLFVNASESERMSLTTGEALCSGCRVLDSFGNWGNEHYRNLARFCPSQSSEQLSAIISEAYHQPEWDFTPNDDARKLTWDSVALAYREVYEACL